MHKKITHNWIIIATIATAAATARVAHAAGWGSFRDIVNSALAYITATIVPLLVLVASIFFFWNLIYYLTKLSNETERTQFKKYSINAILALFIIFSLWGIIGIGTRLFFNVGPFVPQLRVQD